MDVVEDEGQDGGPDRDMEESGDEGGEADDEAGDGEEEEGGWDGGYGHENDHEHRMQSGEDSKTNTTHGGFRSKCRPSDWTRGRLCVRATSWPPYPYDDY